MDKATQLARQFGHEFAEELLDAYVFDTMVPGICTNKGCNYSIEVEHDNDSGWCEVCETRTVKSVTKLLGVM